MKLLEQIFPIFLLLTLFPSIYSHSYLLSPRGDFKSFHKAECRLGGPSTITLDSCPGPCISPTSWQYDGLIAPTIYQRGQFVNMVWARNQHRGGFVRFSLVPISQRMNHTAHIEMAFRYACYESNPHVCEQEHCGTDKWAYSTIIQIPSSYPDGDYVLGWAWFGGTEGGESNFGDYYTCVPVRIEGGQFGDWKSIFHPGENLPIDKYADIGGRCWSGCDEVGICMTEPCRGMAEMPMVPRKFGQQEEKVVTGNAGRVVGVKLVNTVTGMAIREMWEQFAGVIVVGEQSESLSLVAVVDGNVDKVAFYMNGNYLRSEAHSPYSCFGDHDGILNKWEHPMMYDVIKLQVKVYFGHTVNTRDFEFTLVR